jgi:hypothetical protein
MPAIKALTVDFDLIAQSMRDVARDTADYYLDRSNGKVICLSRQLIQTLAKEEAETRLDVPEWEAPMIPMAREIVLMGSTQYVRIPEAFGRPEHAWMIKFAEDFRSQKVKQKMLQGLRGRGSCRRFKEILAEMPDDQQRWNVFRVRHWQEKIQAWLETLGILGVNGAPPRHRSPAK